tara:strand:+ start:1835 stop:2662 length:828 start_codon:yes stop_codon:yes gene_type:complete
MKEFNIDTLVQKVPNRLVNSHKGDYGKVLIIAGTKGMGGAGILSSEACVFCGAGLVTLVTHPDNVQASLERNPEVMVSSEKNNTQQDDNKIALCGPGLGEDNWSEKFFKKFYQYNFKNGLILDAGALNLLSLLDKNSFVNHSKLVLTPHPGEAAKLLKTTNNEIQKNRPKAAKEISKIFNADVILKGYRTVIYSKSDSAVLVCNEGGPELASGGTGDVLAGLLLALIAQNLSTIDACMLAVAVHARAGLIFKENVGELGLNASSLIPICRELLNK